MKQANRWERSPLRSSKRPLYVTWLSLGVLIFSGWYIARLALGLDLPDIPLSVPHWYMSLTGAVWGAMGLAIAYGLFSGHSWARTLARWGALAFAVWYWTDRLFIARSHYLDISWPPALAITLLTLLGLFWLLSRPAARNFFGESIS